MTDPGHHVESSVAHSTDLSAEEEELIARSGSGRGYTPKGEVAEPDDAPAGAAGTSRAVPD